MGRNLHPRQEKTKKNRLSYVELSNIKAKIKCPLKDGLIVIVDIYDNSIASLSDHLSTDSQVCLYRLLSHFDTPGHVTSPFILLILMVSAAIQSFTENSHLSHKSC